MQLKQEMIETLEKNHVSLVLQFGSSVTGGNHPGSDPPGRDSLMKEITNAF